MKAQKIVPQHPLVTWTVFSGDEIPLSSPKFFANVSGGGVIVHLQSPVALPRDLTYLMKQSAPGRVMSMEVDPKNDFVMSVRVDMTEEKVRQLEQSESSLGSAPTTHLPIAFMSVVAVDTIRFRGDTDAKISGQDPKAEADLLAGSKDFIARPAPAKKPARKRNVRKK